MHQGTIWSKFARFYGTVERNKTFANYVHQYFDMKHCLVECISFVRLCLFRVYLRVKLRQETAFQSNK